MFHSKTIREKSVLTNVTFGFSRMMDSMKLSQPPTKPPHKLTTQVMLASCRDIEQKGMWSKNKGYSRGSWVRVEAEWWSQIETLWWSIYLDEPVEERNQLWVVPIRRTLAWKRAPRFFFKNFLNYVSGCHWLALVQGYEGQRRRTILLPQTAPNGRHGTRLSRTSSCLQNIEIKWSNNQIETCTRGSGQLINGGKVGDAHA